MKTPTDPLLVFCMMAEKIFLAYLLHKSIKFGKNGKKTQPDSTKVFQIIA